MCIRTRILDDYEKHYSNILSIRPMHIEAYILANDLELGICFFAKQQYGVDISRERWVISNCVGITGKWWNYPIDVKSIKSHITCIRRRIEILKTII